VSSCDNSSNQKNTVKAGESTVEKQIEKYDNGVVHKIARHIGGKLNGVQEVYNTKGELQNTMNYVDGVKEGNSIIYFKDGKKYRVTPYHNGLIDGERIKYRNNGSLWSTQNYKMGMPENNLKEYSENGKLKSTPELVIKKTRMKGGIVQVDLSVKGNHKRVKYFIGKLKDGKYFDKKSVSMVSTQDRSKATITLNSRNKYYDIIAKVTTQGNNHLFLTKRISL
jgi:antitoxin component YwqK of YwqJK toxin-antitoxin module